jgi:hypothetical protein
MEPCWLSAKLNLKSVPGIMSALAKSAFTDLVVVDALGDGA